MTFSQWICVSISSSSELDTGSGIESVGHYSDLRFPCSLIRNVSLYRMGNLGLSCLSLHVDAVDWLLKLSVSTVADAGACGLCSESGSV